MIPSFDARPPHTVIRKCANTTSAALTITNTHKEVALHEFALQFVLEARSSLQAHRACAHRAISLLIAHRLVNISIVTCKWFKSGQNMLTQYGQCACNAKYCVASHQRMAELSYRNTSQVCCGVCISKKSTNVHKPAPAAASIENDCKPLP